MTEKERVALSEDEREWVHTGSKFIKTDHLPTAGKLLSQFESVSTAIGRVILLGIILLGGIGALVWFGIKVYALLNN